MEEIDRVGSICAESVARAPNRMDIVGGVLELCFGGPRCGGLGVAELWNRQHRGTHILPSA